MIRTEHGTAAVEFVIVLPVLAVFLLGPIEIGRMEYHFQIAAEGVRDAGRFLSQVPVDCSGGAGAGTFVDATDVTKAQNLAGTGSIATPASSSDYVLVSWNDAATTFAATVDCRDNGILNLAGLFAGCGVVPTVTVDVDLRFSFLSSLPFLPIHADLPISHRQVNVSNLSLIANC